MRIFGLIFFGLSAVFTGVLTILFFIFLVSLFNTTFLFAQYRTTGVYSKISAAVQDQIKEKTSEYSDEAESAPNELQAQMQEKIVTSLFSEENVQKTIENNFVKFKNFQNSNDKNFELYLPLNETNPGNIFEGMGLEEIQNDPEFQKMISDAPQQMMKENKALASVSQGAQSLRSSIKLFKYLLPILTLFFLVMFILLGKGIGRIRNLGILLIITAISTWTIFLLEKTIFAMTIQSSSFTSQNFGTEIASLMIEPIFAVGISLTIKSSIFLTTAGILFVLAWFILRMSAAKSVPAARTVKKRT